MTLPPLQHFVFTCHSGKGRNPEIFNPFWTPVFTGVTIVSSKYINSLPDFLFP
jgi:hypothetical protein